MSELFNVRDDYISVINERLLSANFESMSSIELVEYAALMRSLDTVNNFAIVGVGCLSYMHKIDSLELHLSDLTNRAAFIRLLDDDISIATLASDREFIEKVMTSPTARAIFLQNGRVLSAIYRYFDSLDAVLSDSVAYNSVLTSSGALSALVSLNGIFSMINTRDELINAIVLDFDAVRSLVRSANFLDALESFEFMSAFSASASAVRVLCEDIEALKILFKSSNAVMCLFSSAIAMGVVADSKAALVAIHAAGLVNSLSPIAVDALNASQFVVTYTKAVASWLAIGASACVSNDYVRSGKGIFLYLQQHPTNLTYMPTASGYCGVVIDTGIASKAVAGTSYSVLISPIAYHSYLGAAWYMKDAFLRYIPLD